MTMPSIIFAADIGFSPVPEKFRSMIANVALIIEDEPDLRTLYELTLLREGYDIETAESVQEALSLLNEKRYSAVITDMRLPDGTGLDVLNFLESHSRHEKAIVITAYGSAENAVEALKAGAYDYLTKPVDLKQFRAVVASALGRGPTTPPSIFPSNLPAQRVVVPPSSVTSDAADVTRASPPPPAGPSSAALRRMAGDSAAMAQVRSLVGKVARSMAPVLVRGDTVLVPNPSYPIHIWGAVIAGADIRSVRVGPGVDFFAELERAIREARQAAAIRAAAAPPPAHQNPITGTAGCCATRSHA